ncbi:glucose-6-phosphate isomerase [Rhodococcus opacus B4]|uniref:Glucose-6-phosphate isomerase n=1 Tax=Rhodococcus opacus (strain B4) TaxID=632772 RepID=C1B5J4_RHOOB|nr:glucose-6-phosphate isomerase [Rhodococcus opacus B4]
MCEDLEFPGIEGGQRCSSGRAADGVARVERAGPPGPAGFLVRELLRRRDPGGPALRQRPPALPAYLQQLAMESNGKSVQLNGTPADVSTGAVWWGEPGTNGQHAFYQLLHQGTHLVPVDFLGFAEPAADLPLSDGTGSMHDVLVSNLLAQRRVLAFGRTAADLAADGVRGDLIPHKVMAGNRPSTTILAPN